MRSSLFHLLVVSGNWIDWVPSILSELDSETSIASNLVSLHAAQQLSALPRKHWPNDQLNVTLQFRQMLMVSCLHVFAVCRVVNIAHVVVIRWRSSLSRRIIALGALKDLRRRGSFYLGGRWSVDGIIIGSGGSAHFIWEVSVWWCLEVEWESC